MAWQNKLRTLIAAHKQGHEELNEEISYGAPLDSGRVESSLREIVQEFEIDPKTQRSLQDLYSIADGVRFAFGTIKILGLAEGRFAFGQRNDDSGLLGHFNRDYLQIAQDIGQRALPSISICLIFGLDEVGDYFCVTNDGTVVSAGHTITQPQVRADSVDTFLDDVCLGPGFLRLYEPEEDDPWVEILKEFEFIPSKD